ncbi:hypothetical protein AC1031_000982 [Aphanomyces cochlioides]|nr:hypothetical protein AC1031_000982 [Aphanomyces cochlioides]
MDEFSFGGSLSATNEELTVHIRQETMVLGQIAKLYQKSVGKQLRQLGLRYDDALVETAEVQRAVSWLSREESLARTRRHARAADLSHKRAVLPEEIQKIQEDPFKFYLEDKVEEARALADERNKLTKW